MNYTLDQTTPYVYRKKHTGAIVFACVVGLVLIALTVSGTMKAHRLADVYDRAAGMAKAGSYEEAKELFESIEEKDYKDTDAYIYYCQARISYKKGYISSAHYYMDEVRFSHADTDVYKEVEEFESVIESEYKTYLANKTESDIKEYHERTDNTVSEFKPKVRIKYQPEPDDDPYDVNDYSNEEDFYYDHYDDFFDYYDAEDYFKDHHD